jgi:hypothetical protein
MFSSDTRQRDRSLFVIARCKTRIIIPQITKKKKKKKKSKKQITKTKQIIKTKQQNSQIIIQQKQRIRQQRAIV